MAAFQSFITRMAYPPNPNQSLDRTYSTLLNGANPEHGRQIFMNNLTDRGALRCNDCHSAAPGPGTNKTIVPGNALLMANGTPEPQDFKVPQLRGLYQKIGIQNGVVTASSLVTRARVIGPTAGAGRTISVPLSGIRSGFGFIHDGTIDTLFDFLKTPNFNLASDKGRREVEACDLGYGAGRDRPMTNYRQLKHTHCTQRRRSKSGLMNSEV